MSPLRPDPTIDRRRFLELSAASMALAGLTASGCRRWPEQEVRPQARRPEGTRPGMAEYYATLFEHHGIAQPLLAKCYDGRPIHLEGNPQHPSALGAATPRAQAAILDLYDPDRSTGVVQRSRDPASGAVRRWTRSWEDFERFAEHTLAPLRARQGTGLAVLARPSSSPTAARLEAQLRRSLPNLSWYQYQPLHRDLELQGSRQAFGAALRSHLDLERAAILACFDADPLGDHPDALRHARQWARRRSRIERGGMNRLWCVETSFTLTGSVADHRLAVPPSRVAAILGQVLARLGGEPEEARGGALLPDERAFAAALAGDLLANRGEAVVCVGPRQSAEVQVLAHAVNHAIGAFGTTLHHTREPAETADGQVPSLAALKKDIDDGTVRTLVVLGGNPVYDAPGDLVPNLDRPELVSIHLSLHENETSERSTWHLPAAHFLECWGDGRTWDGTYGVQQPTIEPLFGGRSTIEVMALLAGLGKRDGRELVRETARARLGATGFERAWRRLLHDGFLADSATERFAPPSPELGPPDRATSTGARQDDVGPAAPLELQFVPSSSVGDGEAANNGWLQELPDPFTKLTWDNALLLAPGDADSRGLETGDVVRVRTADSTLEIPVYVLPGHARGAATLSLGYGRTHGGHLGTGVGVSVHPLWTSRIAGSPVHATLEATGAKTGLATTQVLPRLDEVGAFGQRVRVGERGRSGTVVREATLAELLEDPEAVQGGEHTPPPGPLFDAPHGFRSGHAWAMTIDLSACIGCNACVIGCQSENNIPIVGREEVARSREMSWLRIDRYFKGDEAAPDVVHMPMACGHCETAPCEQVCPVAATVHDAEGLNTMVYNRCIGTRYCANNCPYKVRRFNYFDYHEADPRTTVKPWFGIPDAQAKEVDELYRMHFNPDVTVRMRGVMEKCSYCVQRIAGAKAQAKLEFARGVRPDDRVRDGEAVPACQAACPTQAIVFGDLLDEGSRVSRSQRDARTYEPLPELGLRARTRYLAKVRNPRDDLRSERG